MTKVWVIWEYEQRRGYDREEPLSPFYPTERLAQMALDKMGLTLPEGYREIREHEVVPLML